MCAAALSLYRTASRKQIDRLDSLVYIESITDAYSKNFVKDIEYNTETVKSADYHLFLSFEQCIVIFAFPPLVI